MVLATVYSALLLSLTCSLALQAGNAGEPIARSAEEVAPVKAGTIAPRFKVRTASNEIYDFDPENLERPTVLITFRGGWCPYCNMHLSELRKVVPEISALGVDVLFLSGDRPELLYASLSQETQETIDSLDYRILSDADANAGIALGLAFKPADRMMQWFESRDTDVDGSSMVSRGAISVPAVYAVSTSGEIAFAHVNADYRIRLPADELLAVAEELVR